jgi:single-stranded-DNA-specific exonuclease
MSFQWIPQEPEDEKVVATLTEELNIIPVLARLLALRKVTTYDEAKLFFRPSLDDLYDPFLMKDMGSIPMELNLQAQ